MQIFLAASFSAKISYETRTVLPEYKAWLEALIQQIESEGDKVFCALRDGGYVINDQDPVAAFTYDMEQLVKSDVLFAVLDEPISAGVQLEIGWANAKGMKTVFAHQLEYKLPWVNATMVQAGLASEILLPLDGRASGNVLRLNDAAAISR